MDSPEGLLVPNIKNVQNMTVLEIATELQRLISLGEAGRLGIDDISGGTFSISNIGSVSQWKSGLLPDRYNRVTTKIGGYCLIVDRRYLCQTSHHASSSSDRSTGKNTGTLPLLPPQIGRASCRERV